MPNCVGIWLVVAGARVRVLYRRYISSIATDEAEDSSKFVTESEFKSVFSVELHFFRWFGCEWLQAICLVRVETIV